MEYNWVTNLSNIENTTIQDGHKNMPVKEHIIAMRTGQRLCNGAMGRKSFLICRRGYRGGCVCLHICKSAPVFENQQRNSVWFWLEHEKGMFHEV